MDNCCINLHLTAIRLWNNNHFVLIFWNVASQELFQSLFEVLVITKIYYFDKLATMLTGEHVENTANVALVLH